MLQIRSASVFIMILSLQLPAAAQKVKLVQSVSTSWAGGIAGKQGVSYEFVVEFSRYGAQPPLPDTLWIGNKCVPLVAKTTPGKPWNMIRAEAKKKVVFTICGGTSNEDDDSSPIRYPGAPEPQTAKKPRPPVKYAGVALLSYMYNGLKCYFVVDRIMTHGNPVNYP